MLTEAGIDAPRVDAELLVAEVLGVPRGRLGVAPDLDAAAYARFMDLVQDRATRRPLQYVIGSAPFRLREVAVGPGVFIPRPETEQLVDWGLAAVRDRSAPVVVDLCSGTGAIALSVAEEHPGARVYAVENAPDALTWLRRNARDEVIVVAGDVTDPATLSTMDGQVDLVLCNPPYVPDGTPVPPEVRQDPRAAVFGGPDGLDVIRKVIPRAAALLCPGGWLGIEHDDSHGEAVPALLRAAGGWTDVTAHRDLAGRPRFATARRHRPAQNDSGRLHPVMLYDCRTAADRDRGVEAAIDAVKRGDLVVMPTDTLYGIGADAFKPWAVTALLDAKGRRNPPPVLVGTRATLDGLVFNLPTTARDLVEAFWPGALTVVVEHAPSLQWDLGNDDGTVAVRMPLHPVALEILRETGPMAVSSANKTGEPPANTAEEARGQLGFAVSVYLETGELPDRTPSSIVDVTGEVPRLLRAGAIPLEKLRDVVPSILGPED